jgi:hypothetical protein
LKLFGPQLVCNNALALVGVLLADRVKLLHGVLANDRVKIFFPTQKMFD